MIKGLEKQQKTLYVCIFTVSRGFCSTITWKWIERGPGSGVCFLVARYFNYSNMSFINYLCNNKLTHPERLTEKNNNSMVLFL